jgi:hypothetical protein
MKSHLETSSLVRRKWVVAYLLITGTTKTTNVPLAMAFQGRQPIITQSTTSFYGSPDLPDEPSFIPVKFARRTNNNDQKNDNRLVSSDNPLDQLLAWLSSDVVSILLGSVGLLTVVIHRLIVLDASSTSADALTLETRADLLAVFACGSVLLDGVTRLDVTTALAESVVLEGNHLSEPEINLEEQNEMEDSEDDGNNDIQKTLIWALNSLLCATPAQTAIVLKQNSTGEWKIQSRAGVVPTNPSSLSSHTTTWGQVPEKSPILDRVGSRGNNVETYLPTLSALPGRLEFTYLPSNTQLALLIPTKMSDGGCVLVLGSNTAKSFSPRDIAWSRVIAERIGEYV